jgi:hypothetical protein
MEGWALLLLPLEEAEKLQILFFVSLVCVSLSVPLAIETASTPSTTAAQRQRRRQTHKLPNIQHKVPPRQLLHRHCKPRKLEEITANAGGAHVAMVMMMTMMMHHRPGSSLPLSSSLRNTHSGFVQNPPLLSQQHHSVTVPCLSSSTTTSSFQLRIATQIYNLRPWHIL